MSKTIIVIILALLLSSCSKMTPPTEKISQDDISKKAQEIYRQAQIDGTDFTDGPCLSNDLVGNGDWVLDIASDPRQNIDNQPENQCSAYRDGTASHFVELDQSGRLIRIQ